MIRLPQEAGPRSFFFILNKSTRKNQATKKRGRMIPKAAGNKKGVVPLTGTTPTKK